MAKIQFILARERGVYDGNTQYYMFDAVLDSVGGNRFILVVPEVCGRSYLDRNFWRPEADFVETLDIADGLALSIRERSGDGVISGMVVAAQTSANMTVSVTAGVAYMPSGLRRAPAAVAALAVPAADATNARKDIVYLSAAGVVTYLAGTPAASPSAPALPAGGVLLAEIAVAANATSIATENITKKRKMLVSDAIFKTE